MDLNPKARSDLETVLQNNEQVLNQWFFKVNNHVYAQRAFNRVRERAHLGGCCDGSHT